MAYQRVTSSDSFTTGATAATTVINAVEAGLEAAEVGIALLKAQTYSPMEILNVNDLRLTTTPIPITIPTPDGTGVIVHPSCLYFPNGWNGYRYWMVSTGYASSNNQVENPDLTVSNDGINFSALAGVSHPLVPSPGSTGFNSDPHLVLGPDNVLYMYYREYGINPGDGTLEHIKVTYSSNGTTWSTPSIVHSAVATVSDPVSPSVWYDYPTKTWFMLVVDNFATPYFLKRYSSTTPTGTFANDASVTVTNGWYSTLGPWHFEVTNLGDQLVGLVQDGSSSGGQLNVLTSMDSGLTWTRNPIGLGNGRYYKSTMVARQSTTGLVFDVFGQASSAMGSPAIRKATLTANYASNISAACNRISPFVIGDSFSRANSTTSLGTATSGQTWTAWAGTMGILNGQGYVPTATNCKTVIDSGLSDLKVSVEMIVPDTEFWLIFRGQDTSNYWRFGFTGASYILQKVVTGSLTTPTLTLNLNGQGIRANDRIGVICSGSSIVCTVNGLPVIEATDTTFQTNTFAGVQASTTPTRFDNFMVSTL